MPIGAIVHLSIDNTPLFLNMSIDTAVPNSEPIKVTKDDKSKRSLEALLNNPKNKKLLKK
jgi:hypothetical protein